MTPEADSLVSKIVEKIDNGEATLEDVLNAIVFRFIGLIEP